MFLFNVLYAEGYLHNTMSLFQASRFSEMLVRLCVCLYNIGTQIGKALHVHW